MSNFHTNLSVSQKIASLGVKAESEFMWRSDGGNFFRPKKDTIAYEKQMGCLFSYGLDELADVLREVGEIKGWKVGVDDDNYTTLCRTFFLLGESAANKYLEEIL
jgi:hypothetical protein